MPEADRPDVSPPATAAPGNSPWPPPGINAAVAHPARVYDYFLGGKDNFAADRALGDALAAQVPSAPYSARANRAFLGRAVRYLVQERGIRQFLDIGTGIPSAGNTHEVAQALAPDTRALYVDNDPIVLAHARALTSSHPAGATAYIQADAREPEKILADPALRGTLDLDRPVALMMLSILPFFGAEEDPQGIVSTLLGALPPGSYLTISHITADFIGPEQAGGAVTAGRQRGVTYVPRTQAEVAAFFSGLELVEPGVVPILTWHPDGGMPADPHAASHYAGMARKPLRARPGRVPGRGAPRDYHACVTYAQQERAALAALLEKTGPDGPTLCEGWQTRDLVAHLVLRERRPDAAAGVLGGPLAGYTARIQRQYQDRHSYPALIAMFQAGPPPLSPFSIPGADEAANTVEYFVHHEDVRRAAEGWTERDLPDGLSEALWKRLGGAKLFLRSAPTGVVLAWAGADDRRVVAKNATPSVTVTGSPAELTLWAMGRTSAAHVTLDGPEDAVAKLSAWRR